MRLLGIALDVGGGAETCGRENSKHLLIDLRTDGMYRDSGGGTHRKGRVTHDPEMGKEIAKIDGWYGPGGGWETQGEPGPVCEEGGEREVAVGRMQGRDLEGKNSANSDEAEKYSPRRPENVPSMHVLTLCEIDDVAQIWEA